MAFLKPFVRDAGENGTHPLELLSGEAATSVEVGRGLDIVHRVRRIAFLLVEVVQVTEQ